MKFIEVLTAKINEILPTTYESAPVESAYCYAVVSGLYIQNPSEHEDAATFYIELFANETAPPDESSTTETLEAYCDAVRTTLQNEIIYSAGVFYAHIGFEGRATSAESEHDLNHRRLTFSAKIFYIGG